MERPTIRRVVMERGKDKPRLVRAPPPRADGGEVRVRTLVVGLDGTDAEVVAHPEKAFPAGRDDVTLGHECLAEVFDAPEGSGFLVGDRVVPLVRHGCGACPMCLRGRQDHCETGRYREHGIVALDGFLQDEWVDDPATLVRVPDGMGFEAALAEPLSIVLKALETIEAVQSRLPVAPGLKGRRVLVAGAGTLGVLAGYELHARGARIWSYDRSPADAAAPALLRRMGARHTQADGATLSDLAREADGFDVVIEATGSPHVLLDAALALAENGALCSLGVPAEKPAFPVEADDIMRALVLKNQCIVGSVNSHRGHVEAALGRLREHGARWGSLARDVLSHRYEPEAFGEAFRPPGDDVVKKAIVWADEGHA